MGLHMVMERGNRRTRRKTQKGSAAICEGRDRLHGELAVDIRGNADHELAAELPACEWLVHCYRKQRICIYHDLHMSSCVMIAWATASISAKESDPALLTNRFLLTVVNWSAIALDCLPPNVT